jgi:translation initiation factor 1A
MLGNGWVDAQCIDGKKRLAHIRGAFRKKVWITVGDVILLGLRDFEDDKADIILKYLPDEARSLKAYGELPENTKINEVEAGPGGEEDLDLDIEFDIDEVCLFYWSLANL